MVIQGICHGTRVSSSVYYKSVVDFPGPEPARVNRSEHLTRNRIKFERHQRLEVFSWGEDRVNGGQR